LRRIKFPEGNVEDDGIVVAETETNEDDKMGPGARAASIFVDKVDTVKGDVAVMAIPSTADDVAVVGTEIGRGGRPARSPKDCTVKPNRDDDDKRWPTGAVGGGIELRGTEGGSGCGGSECIDGFGHPSRFSSLFCGS
jgi:hypothetical protein